MWAAPGQGHWCWTLVRASLRLSVLRYLKATIQFFRRLRLAGLSEPLFSGRRSLTEVKSLCDASGPW